MYFDAKCFVFIPEPDEGDGGLLHGPHEALRRLEDGAAHTQRSRLHRLHAHALPELSAHVRPPRRLAQY